MEVLATAEYLDGLKLSDRSMLHSSVTCLTVCDIWVIITLVPARTLRGPAGFPARYRPQSICLPRLWGSRYLPVKMVAATSTVLVTFWHVLNDLLEAAKRIFLTTVTSCNMRDVHYDMLYLGGVPKLR